jgi:hypothetical protein
MPFDIDLEPVEAKCVTKSQFIVYSIAGNAVYKLHYRWPTWDRKTEKRFANWSMLTNPIQKLETPQLYNVVEDLREENALNTNVEPYSSIVREVNEAKDKHLKSLDGAPPSHRVGLFKFYKDVMNPLRCPYVHFWAPKSLSRLKQIFGIE